MNQPKYGYGFIYSIDGDGCDRDCLIDIGLTIEEIEEMELNAINTKQIQSKTIDGQLIEVSL